MKNRKLESNHVEKNASVLIKGLNFLNTQKSDQKEKNQSIVRIGHSILVTRHQFVEVQIRAANP